MTRSYPDISLEEHNAIAPGCYRLHEAQVYDQQHRREEIWRWRGRRDAAEGWMRLLYMPVALSGGLSFLGWWSLTLWAVLMASFLGSMRWELYCRKRLRELGE